MASISSTGIGSGLDVTNIITQLVALEKQPLKTLELKATTVNAQVSALGDIKSQFAGLTDVATRLSTADAWAARNASSSNTSAATIAVTGAAAATSFTLDVDALAQRQAVSSEAITAGSFVGAGTMTIRVGTWSGNISANAGADNTAQAAADASSPALAAAQAALLAAQTDLATATTALGDRNTDLTAANTALGVAQGVLVTKNAALADANAALAPFTATLASANLALTNANSALQAATNTKTAAETASTAADLASTNADAAVITANTDVGTATTASDNADLALSNAFSADNTAASALAAFAVGTPVAKSYSDAYTAWVSAVATNDHLTPSLQAAENAALSARNIAYTTFGLVAGSASTAANLTRDNALAADTAAAVALATYSGAGPSALKTYSDAYTAWTSAVAANDHATPALQTAESDALITKDAAYTALGQVVVTAQSDASAANVARDNALSADSGAAHFLTTLATGTPLVQSYSNAYTAWVSAVAANDHVTPALQTAENDALATKSAAYTAMGQVGAAELTAANLARDNALTADNLAVTDLATLAGAGPSALKDYSDFYAIWTSAVATQTGVASALADKNAAYLLLSAPEKIAADAVTGAADAIDTSPLIVAAQTAASTRAAALISGAAAQAAADAVTGAADLTDASALKGAALTAAGVVTTAQATLAGANAITATADATDASALMVAATTAAGVVAAADALTVTAGATDASSLKTAAVSAAAAKTAAIATAAIATSAAATALTNKTSAAADVVTATNALVAPDAAQISAAADVVTATNDPLAATATAAQIAAAGDVTIATGVRDTAQGSVTSATTARNTAQSLVTTTTSAVTVANNNVTSATALRPTFTAAAGSSDFTITATATDTVAKLAAKINAAGVGVVATAFFDGTKDRLQLTSKDSGMDAGFRVQVSDTGDSVDTDNSGLSRMAYDPGSSAYGMASSGIPATYGSDARARINGLAVTSKTNTLTGNMTGVTIDLKAVTTSSATMSISEDVTLAVKNVNDFVTAYNALNKTLANLTKYDAGTKTASLFQADSSILGLQSVLRNMLGSVSTGSAYQRLNDIGMERQLDGSLKMNTTRLSTAANNGTELQKLFTADNSNTLTNGFAKKFATLGTGLLGLSGAVANKAAALQSALDRNSKDQTKVNERAIAVEARLRKTYSALDTKMASLTALNSYVAQQVTAWNKSTG
jgi:flagellar hook-associated protein 2